MPVIILMRARQGANTTINDVVIIVVITSLIVLLSLSSLFFSPKPVLVCVFVYLFVRACMHLYGIKDTINSSCSS